jgi:alanyl-tRNA synthetase
MDKYTALIQNNQLIARFDGLEAATLKQMADHLLTQTEKGFIFLASVKDEKVTFVAKSANPSLHCGKLVKEAALICGGNGGGRPDFAQAGGKDTAKIEEALNAIRELVR